MRGTWGGVSWLFHSPLAEPLFHLVNGILMNKSCRVSGCQPVRLDADLGRNNSSH
jgi:hypothetical protein